jgi:hypothetical protein
MDEHLHRDFGNQFRDEINSLKQQPRKHIWENIDKALDKEEVKNYKEKYLLLRKTLLLLLFTGITGFLAFYFTTSKNRNGNNPSAVQKINTNNVSFADKQQQAGGETAVAAISYNQSPSAVNIFSAKNSLLNSFESLYQPTENFLNNKANTSIKIKDGDIGYAEDATTVPVETKESNTTETGLTPGPALPKIPSAINENTLSETTTSTKIKTNEPAVSKTATTAEAKNKEQKNNSHRFTLLAFAGPDYSDYRLINNTHNNYDNKAGIEKRERSDLSSSFGILLGYAVGKRISLQSGVVYSSSNISINPTEIYAEKNNAGSVKYRYNTSYGYGYLQPSFSSSPAVGDSLFADGANHTLHYITVPVMVKYKIGRKKLTFNPAVGVGLNILTKATLTTDLVDNLNRETESISKLEGIKKLSASLIFTPGLQYQLSKKMAVSLSPSFKYSLGSINKGNVVKTYPYTIGVGLGVVYKF